MGASRGQGTYVAYRRVLYLLANYMLTEWTYKLCRLNHLINIVDEIHNYAIHPRVRLLYIKSAEYKALKKSLMNRAAVQNFACCKTRSVRNITYDPFGWG